MTAEPQPTEVDLKSSYVYCRDLTRRAATNFYYSFKTLPRRKRVAFEVVYAFMRLSDDLSDDEAESPDKSGLIARWREMLEEAWNGNVHVHPVMPALMEVCERFDIPRRYLDELIDGVASDLEVTRYRTFEELYGYCYKVASVVGLVALRIFGLRQPDKKSWDQAETLAEFCGIAFQITNILRDIREDLERGRVYVPLDDLERYGLTEERLAQHPLDDAFKSFMRFEADRAQDYYDRSEALVGMLASDARPCLVTMREIYHELLIDIRRRGYDIWSARARVPLPRKLGIAARAFFRRFGS